MKFDAIYYDGLHPIGRNVTLLINDAGTVKVIGAEDVYQCHWQELVVSNQLGNTARTIQFPNGAQCECHDHVLINQLEKKYRSSTFSRCLHNLESHWQSVILAGFIVVAFSWGMVIYGIPALAKTVAESLPVSVDESLTQGTLSLLDGRLLSSSKLDPKIKQRIEQKFSQMVENVNDEHTYRLLFRKGDAVGANAFALPSGHIVVTDELIEIADHDEEVLAVLAHEIGHVVHEHGLRSVLQSSAVALLLTAVTGDIGAASGFAAAMPILLLETNYSRKFELEADAFALDYLQTHDIDPTHFATILQKITGDDGSDHDSPFSYISTHPETHKRLRPFLEHSHQDHK